MSFLQLPEEIHTEIISYLSPFYELLLEKNQLLAEKNFYQLKPFIPIVMNFRLIHPNYSKIISKHIDEFCWILYDRVFDIYSLSNFSNEFTQKFNKIGIVKSLGSFLHLIRTREKQGKVFRRKFYSPTIEVLLRGRGGSGKTSIVTRYIFGQFYPEYDPTCYEVYKRTISVDNQEDTINFEDTCGQEEFEDYYWRNYQFDVLILVCSMTDKKSLEELKPLMRKFVERKGENAPCIVAMNKCDLHDWYEISVEMVEEVVKEFDLKNCTIVKTSAKDGDNIEELVEECVRKYRVRIEDPKRVLEEVLSLYKHKKGCQVA